MKLRRDYCSEGFLAFWLDLEPAEVEACESALGRRLEFDARDAPAQVLQGIYEIGPDRMEIAPRAWLPPSGDKAEDPLTAYFRPLAKPLIDAELALADRERARALLAECHSRGWAVFGNPSAALRDLARGVAAGEAAAVETLAGMEEELKSSSKPGPG